VPRGNVTQAATVRIRRRAALAHCAASDARRRAVPRKATASSVNELLWGVG